VNKENTISEADYKNYVPRRRQKSNTQMELKGVGKDKSDKKGKSGISLSDNFVAAVTERGVIVQKPDYLSAFTVDKDKIDFYKQAQVLKENMAKAEKNRGKRMTEKVTAAATVNNEKMSKALVN
jgi:hypothetical protein